MRGINWTIKSLFCASKGCRWCRGICLLNISKRGKHKATEIWRRIVATSCFRDPACRRPSRYLVAQGRIPSENPSEASCTNLCLCCKMRLINAISPFTEQHHAKTGEVNDRRYVLDALVNSVARTIEMRSSASKVVSASWVGLSKLVARRHLLERLEKYCILQEITDVVSTCNGLA